MGATNDVERPKPNSFAAIAARSAAYAVDGLLLFVALVAGQWLLDLLGLHPLAETLRSGSAPAAGRLHLWVSLSTTLPFLLYFAVGFASSGGGTVGMRLLRLEVVGRDGRRIGFGRALLRGAVMLVPFEANHAVLFHLADDAPALATLGFGGVLVLIFAYLASIRLSREGRSLHDLAAGTRVRWDRGRPRASAAT